MYDDILVAFSNKNDIAIARCARQSTQLHINWTGNRFLKKALKKAGELDVLGLLATHSGTCGGFLLPGNTSEDTIACLEAEVAEIGHVFRAKTLKMLF